MRALFAPARVPKKSCQGFTLVELMISLVLGLLLTAVIGYAYVGSRQAFRTMDALSRMQENARYVFETMSHDLRMTGFAGCRSIPPGSPPSGPAAINVLSSPTDWYKNLFGQPLIGYQDTAPPGVCTTANTSPCYLRGDALTVLRADNTKEPSVAVHNPGAQQITTTANHNFKPGEILVVADCANAALFQASAASGSVITYAGSLGTTFPANSSRVMPLSAVTYYIGQNPAGEPALYREKLGTSGVTAGEELVEGVENIQITYGVDTSGPADKAVDAYSTADTVANWANVLSARISLSMVSRSDEKITTATSGDRLLRKGFTTTISMRNRL